MQKNLDTNKWYCQAEQKFYQCHKTTLFSTI